MYKKFMLKILAIKHSRQHAIYDIEKFQSHEYLNKRRFLCRQDKKILLTIHLRSISPNSNFF